MLMIDWRAILEDHGPTVWRIVYRLLNHHADALDCYQETFLTAYGAAERQSIANWACFLSALATRRTIDRLRRRIRARKRFCPIDSIAEPVSESDSPIEAATALGASRAFWASPIGPSHRAAKNRPT
jgi:DNA-directed RNA polymerase specialized sigma24 family protein